MDFDRLSRAPPLAPCAAAAAATAAVVAAAEATLLVLGKLLNMKERECEFGLANPPPPRLKGVGPAPPNSKLLAASPPTLPLLPSNRPSGSENDRAKSNL